MSKITFANRHREDGKSYDQGETYDVDPATARAFVRAGKARYADEAATVSALAEPTPGPAPTAAPVTPRKTDKKEG